MYIHDHNCTSASQMIQKVGLYILFKNGSIFFYIQHNVLGCCCNTTKLPNQIQQSKVIEWMLL